MAATAKETMITAGVPINTYLIVAKKLAVNVSSFVKSLDNFVIRQTPDHLKSDILTNCSKRNNDWVNFKD